MESFVTLYYLIHWQPGPGQGPGPKDPRRRRPNPDLDPHRAVRRIPFPLPALPHIFFLTSWASRSSPPAPASDKFSTMDSVSVTTR